MCCMTVIYIYDYRDSNSLSRLNITQFLAFDILRLPYDTDVIMILYILRRTHYCDSVGHDSKRSEGINPAPKFFCSVVDILNMF